MANATYEPVWCFALAGNTGAGVAHRLNGETGSGGGDDDGCGRDGAQTHVV